MENSQKKSYLLAFSTATRSEVRDWLNAMKTVILWRYDMSNAFYIVSKNSADQISDEFREISNGNHGRFLISEISSNKQGWLTPDSWHLINKKEYSKK